MTPATHKWFPITAGAHALGRAMSDGVMTCESCHAAESATFKDMSCLGCHVHGKTVTDRLHVSVRGFSYASAACLDCHPTGAKVAFDHAGISNDCSMCHAPNAPFAALPRPGFTHRETGGADCGGSCHRSTTSWADVGALTQGSHDPSADVVVEALTPTYTGTTITSVTPLSQTLHMPMNHASTDLPAAASTACSNCHPGAATGVFFPGVLHASLRELGLPQPGACNSCHPSSAPSGFVGPLDSKREPVTGAMKHDARVWSGTTQTTLPELVGDCGVCHVSPNGATTPWARSGDGGVPSYHASLVAAGSAPPSSCLDCHANSRPSGAVLLDSTNASLPANRTFDHGVAEALADCRGCHASSLDAGFASWADGRFHQAGAPAPATCLPCHAARRPVNTTGWQSPTYTDKPFDYGTNSSGVTHGNGLDCKECHAGAGTGVWGSTQNWQGGHFTHAPTSVASRTCIACHKSQRPDLLPGTTPAAMATLLGFDHSINGSGECLGCHQATLTARAFTNYFNPVTHMLPGGDWDGGLRYPGEALASSGTEYINVTEWKLTRPDGGLVTGMNATTATLYDGMKHTSAALPPELNAGPASSPEYGKCWHCHTHVDGVVTEFREGVFHAALSTFRATLDAGVTPFPQPTAHCSDCHGAMTPQDIVQKSASPLQPMDHAAQFTAPTQIGAVTASAVPDLGCAACHQSTTSWADGVFHAKIAAATPKDCVTCHYPLMASSASADVTSGKTYAMRHLSSTLKTQACDTCHTTALAKSKMTPLANTLWKTGAYHGSVSAQPTLCGDCHTVSKPANNASTQSTVTYTLTQGATATNGAQWMNHGSGVLGSGDCATCHQADAKASGSAWNKSLQLHPIVGPISTCNACHGLSNGGGSVPGTKNNLPAGIITTATVSSVDAASGVAVGTHDQLQHSDGTVTSRECGFCHTQQGVASSGPAQGKEWAQAVFHLSYGASASVPVNKTTARCSNCHLNLKPPAGFTTQDHTALSNAAGTPDCDTCHSWPGTGTPTAPNWRGAQAMPAEITVGGFAISQPPATAPRTQAGIARLPHPNVPVGMSCASCHDTSGGKAPTKPASGYDHASNLISTSCNACHEAGSDLVSKPWSSATQKGNTRPWSFTPLVPSFSGSTRALVDTHQHFFPVDCGQCHTFPFGVVATPSTGATFVGRWRFSHNFGRLGSPVETCALCHGEPNNIPD